MLCANSHRRDTSVKLLFNCFPSSNPACLTDVVPILCCCCYSSYVSVVICNQRYNLIKYFKRHVPRIKFTPQELENGKLTTGWSDVSWWVWNGLCFMFCSLFTALLHVRPCQQYKGLSSGFRFIIGWFYVFLCIIISWLVVLNLVFVSYLLVFLRMEI